MLYQSSRGQERKHLSEIIVDGLAPDGGLYSPIELPSVSDVLIQELMATTSVKEAIKGLFEAFSPSWPTKGDLDSLIEAAYSEFRIPELSQIKSVSQDLSLLDLTQGPTFAFKDFALCLLGPLLDHALEGQNSDSLPAVVLGATSGDTGSAAINGLKSCDGFSVVMLHPHGKVSEIQRRQMTTVTSSSVHNLAVDGSFDDCQDLVKQSFVDTNLRNSMNLIAVNSVNFARVLIQISYYIAGVNQWKTQQSSKPGGVTVPNIVVPTGNCGNVLAAWYAKQLGADIGNIVVATNENDSFVRFLESGELNHVVVRQTPSPSMDIQIPSNLERILWHFSGQDSQLIASLMAEYKTNKNVKFPDEIMEQLRSEFMAGSASNEETFDTIAKVYNDHQIVIDPHTAAGVAVARKLDSGANNSHNIVAETAAPDKFLDAVSQAIGARPGLHPQLEELLGKSERYEQSSGEYSELVDKLSKVASLHGSQ